MHNEVILQKVQIDQFALFQEICSRVYTINFGDHWIGKGLENYLEDQFGTDRLTRDLEDPSVHYFFINYDQQIVGFLKVKLGVVLDEKPTLPSAEVEKIYILPEFKGKGIGRNTMEQTIQFLQKEGIKMIFLCVIDTNKNALEFYKKLDFRIYGRMRLDAENFKDELRGMYIMTRQI